MLKNLIEKIVNRDMKNPYYETAAETNAYLQGYARCQNDIIDLLKEEADKGRFVALPCAIGDEIGRLLANGKMEKCKVRRFTIDEIGISVDFGHGYGLYTTNPRLFFETGKENERSDTSGDSKPERAN